VAAAGSGDAPDDWDLRRVRDEPLDQYLAWIAGDPPMHERLKEHAALERIRRALVSGVFSRVGMASQKTPFGPRASSKPSTTRSGAASLTTRNAPASSASPTTAKSRAAAKKARRPSRASG
jgi:hypothetical protein